MQVWVDRVTETTDKALTYEGPAREFLVALVGGVRRPDQPPQGRPGRDHLGVGADDSPIATKTRVLRSATQRVVDHLRAQGTLRDDVDALQMCRLAGGVAVVADQGELDPAAVRSMLGVLADRSPALTRDTYTGVSRRALRALLDQRVRATVEARGNTVRRPRWRRWRSSPAARARPKPRPERTSSPPSPSAPRTPDATSTATPSPAPSATTRSPEPEPEPEPDPQLATRGRPREARLSIPALGLSGLRVVPYAGTPDDGPGTPIQDRRVRRQPLRQRGPGRAGWDRQLPYHRPSLVVDGAVPLPPSVRVGARVILVTVPIASLRGRPHPPYVVPLGRSLRDESAAVPGRPGREPTRAMITLSTCATPEDHAAGNFWSDEFHDPEHRIEKIGVLRSVRRV